RAAEAVPADNRGRAAKAARRSRLELYMMSSEGKSTCIAAIDVQSRPRLAAGQTLIYAARCVNMGNMRFGTSPVFSKVLVGRVAGLQSVHALPAPAAPTQIMATSGSGDPCQTLS